LGQFFNNPNFQKGIKSLDANADMNLISFLSKLKPDAFYKFDLKLKPADFGSWQFFDMVSLEEHIATGLTISETNPGLLQQTFGNIEPQPTTLLNYVPFAVDQSFVLTFDDFDKFLDNLSKSKEYAPNEAVTDKDILDGLTGVNFFRENHNKALVLHLTDVSNFTGEATEKIKEFNNYEIYKFKHSALIKNYFSIIFPDLNLKFYTVIENQVLLTENQAYLEKVLNDIQNHAVLSNSETFKALSAEIPSTSHLLIFKNKLDLKGQKYMMAQTYQIDKDNIFTNLILKNLSGKQHSNLVEQVVSVPLKDLPNAAPQLVYNHHSKYYNIIYQDDQNNLTLLDLTGKTLWQTPLKDQIIGRIHQVDLFRNRKLQYTFVTPHHWYVIDRLGRMVEDFPQHFMPKITQGLSVFDYDQNRKYRFGITQSKKFKLFDNKAKKVKGFKVKAQADIVKSPKHFRIGNKDFIQMFDANGKLYLLNRRGSERIKVSKKFETLRNDWGVYHKKFVNIDDNDNLLSIDLSGKLKTGKLDFGQQILSDIAYDKLAAVAGHKLLIDKTIKELDLGSYERPQIYKSRNNIYIFVANSDNNRIYAFDSKGQLLPNFPIIGQQILDFKSDKNGRYLMVYDNDHNLIVYRF
jgi:hypothetical protein